ncbi:hypothetical protein AVEN_148535-1 [Araneus ventricosus]|uniref:Uncharacterized protein n=1 Tax=Araneus ventricosus TaxID=182803 RepID=A0A4Y2MAC5_ARAVE|nr:hypothetical protein AVEN_148535-1 [Araneus ventricosus]
MEEDKVKILKSATENNQPFNVTGFTQLDEFDIQSIRNKSKIPILAYDSDNKYTLHPSALIDISIFMRDKNLKLAYNADDCYHLIELLIGSDLYWTIVLAEAPKYISPSSTLYISKIG